MKGIGFYSRLLTRNWGENFRRIIDAHSRYGVNGSNMIQRITRLMDLLERFNVSATFPLPAVVLKKYPQFFTRLVEKGVELAVHGYRHVDYTRFSLDRVEQELEEAFSIFHALGVFPCGFRFPFLRKDFSLVERLGQIGYAWDSSVSRYWDVVPWEENGEKGKMRFDRILATYEAFPAEKKRNLPYWIGQTLEIPVSLPDDDMILDRIGNRDPQFLLNVWSQILKQVRDRKEVFVLQAHPERYDFFYISLCHLLEEAKTCGDVWIANLGEIAKWWKERFNARFTIEKWGKNQWKVILNGPRYNLKRFSNGIFSEIPLYPEKRSMYCVIQSSKCPCIGVHPKTAVSVIQWLKQEGILYEVGLEESRYEIFLYEPKPNISNVSKKIFASNRCILKFGEWPAPFRSALAISGDIDSMDIWGFWSKLYAS